MPNPTPDSLSVKEAIEQGYTLYGYANSDGYQSLYNIKDIDHADFEEFSDIVLAEKEPMYACVSEKCLYEDIADDIMCSEECMGDDTNEILELIKGAVNWKKIADKINAALQTRPYYTLTQIKLVP